MSTTTKTSFTERRDPPAFEYDDEDSDYEFGDDEVRRIIIVAQQGSSSSTVPVPLGSKDKIKHEGFDRTSDWEVSSHHL